MGCSWSSRKFDYRAPNDCLLIRAFVGGPGNEQFVELDDTGIVGLVRSELADITGITAEPIVERVFRWKHANPQYDVGHSDLISRIEQSAAKISGLFIADSMYRGTGIPDCVHSGMKTAYKAQQQFVLKNS
jgi:oxygen-dependent protoporphyrinogen oxidase